MLPESYFLLYFTKFPLNSIGLNLKHCLRINIMKCKIDVKLNFSKLDTLHKNALTLGVARCVILCLKISDQRNFLDFTSSDKNKPVNYCLPIIIDSGIRSKITGMSNGAKSTELPFQAVCFLRYQDFQRLKLTNSSLNVENFA